MFPEYQGDSAAGAAVTVTDFMGGYMDKSGMDFYFASSHHVDKTPESYAVLRQDLSQYSAITGMQEVYPIEYLLDVPEEKITEGYDEIWKQFYPVDRPFMNIPAYNALSDNQKTVEIIPVNPENFRELTFTGKLIYEELSVGKFKSLKRCTTCSAPVRPHTH